MLLVILGVACMFIPGLLQAEGMRRVGAQRAAIGSTIGPPTTIFLAACSSANGSTPGSCSAAR